MQVDKPNAKPSAATVPTVTMETCAIFIMVLGVSVNLAQEKLTELAQHPPITELPAESLNAKVFVSVGMTQTLMKEFLHKLMIVKLGFNVE